MTGSALPSFITPPESGVGRGLRLAALFVAALAAGHVIAWWHLGAGGSGGVSPEYQETVRVFYRALASLEVGLLDEARDGFAEAAALAPEEPAIQANLAVAETVMGNDAGATAALGAAAGLAPDSAEIAYLQGQLASFAGLADEALMHYRRAAELDAGHLRARFALAQELERSGDAAVLAEARTWLEEVVDGRPDNLALLLERARWAAAADDAPVLADTLARLRAASDAWPALAVTQLDGLAAATGGGDLARAATFAQLLRNVLVRTATFREDLALVSVSAEQIAEPFDRFLTLPSPSQDASPPDRTLVYVQEPIAGTEDAAAALTVVPPSNDRSAAIFVVDGGAVRPIGPDAVGAAGPFDFPGGAAGTPRPADGLRPLDWNSDYRMDLALAGADGLRLLVQGEDGTFGEATLSAADEATTAPAADADLTFYGIWAADVEMDGDLDIVAGPDTASPWVARNNADGTWRTVRPFPDMPGLRGFVWGDLDFDGDPDAVLLDADGALHPMENLQAGRFAPWPAPDPAERAVAVALGDLNADGRLDLVSLDTSGSVWRSSVVADRWDTWDRDAVVMWSGFPDAAPAGSYRLLLADFDNNGALDLAGSGVAGTQVWLADERSALDPDPVADVAGVEVFAASDLNGDGWIDFAGLDGGAPVRLLGQGSAGYGWHRIFPRANVAAGDQRINSFGIGGEMEARAGLLVQKQVMTGGPVHFGLGTQPRIDVARVVWPNGVMQADFELAARDVLVVEQRLKGSCPWLFAYDGETVRFVTDFLWRSPLGMRINAQDTVGVSQTEDWVLVRGDQLVARDGQYDLRVTAELWESHFIDHVSLMVVDHPPATELYVDERFARDPAPLRPFVTGVSHPVARAVDDQGVDVTALVRKRDDDYVATFERGWHQGITRDHYLEVELDTAAGPVPAEGDVYLLAYGWIYPTDSSINVALGQSTLPPPRGVRVEAQAPDGAWSVMHEDVGFPAGKLKTMVIPLLRHADGSIPTRLRLRTNLEIYFDRIAHAAAAAVTGTTARLLADVADLRYRGYNVTEFVGPRRIEIPRYELANIRPIWRDLVGFHTRFGDVRELLTDVDDRYAILNAGDELRLRFAAPPEPPAGWRRDFILIGDGWVKDGDFNTAHAKTVGPLPSHDTPDYPREPYPTLEDDPVYQRYPKDWERYHTRWVAPDQYLRGLRRLDR